MLRYNCKTLLMNSLAASTRRAQFAAASAINNSSLFQKCNNFSTFANVQMQEAAAATEQSASPAQSSPTRKAFEDQASTMIIKTLHDLNRRITKNQLFELVQQNYPGKFASKRYFKKILADLVARRVLFFNPNLVRKYEGYLVHLNIKTRQEWDNRTGKNTTSTFFPPVCYEDEINKA